MFSSELMNWIFEYVVVYAQVLTIGKMPFAYFLFTKNLPVYNMYGHKLYEQMSQSANSGDDISPRKQKSWI